ncbi:MAG: hypothetical protein K2X42_06235, partial [Burkholderiaceae bacterium]|nr:hypothetical protein [Burkholderiaceae bacterium]
EVSRTKFVKVFPNEYRRALSELATKSAEARQLPVDSVAAAASEPPKTRPAEKKRKLSPAK